MRSYNIIIYNQKGIPIQTYFAVKKQELMNRQIALTTKDDRKVVIHFGMNDTCVIEEIDGEKPIVVPGWSVPG